MRRVIFKDRVTFLCFVSLCYKKMSLREGSWEFYHVCLFFALNLEVGSAEQLSGTEAWSCPLKIVWNYVVCELCTTRSGVTPLCFCHSVTWLCHSVTAVQNRKAFVCIEKTWKSALLSALQWCCCMVLLIWIIWNTTHWNLVFVFSLKVISADGTGSAYVSLTYEGPSQFSALYITSWTPSFSCASLQTRYHV